MANPELGAKQICPNCQTKFYDLGRRPAVCPKCATAFDPEEAVKSRRVRARTVAPNYDTDEEVEEKKRDDEGEGFEDEVEDTPEIDETPAEPVEAEEGEEGGPTPTPDSDLGVDYEEEGAELAEDEAEDVPFLEEEDEDFPDDEIEGLPEDEREP